MKFHALIKRAFVATAVAILYLSPVDGSNDQDDKFVTCGSAVKVRRSGKPGETFYLSSSNQSLGSGSGQQIVTFIPQKSTYGTLWQVKSSNDSPPCVPGEAIACNSIIRLEHLETGKNLHSHMHRSVLSGQQEVSAFGNGGNGDVSDNWKVECGAKYWKREVNFRLMHQETVKYLGASSSIKFDEKNCGGSCPIMNHLESFARARKDEHTILQVDLGVHLYKE